MESKRPIGSLTLAQASTICKSHDCGYDCPLWEDGCRLEDFPVLWRLPKGVAEDDAPEDTVQTPDKPVSDAEAPGSYLAKVLGVRENEEWQYVGLRETFRIHNGVREYRDSAGNWSPKGNEMELCEILNHPEKIIHLSKLTVVELAICKAAGAKWVSRDEHSAHFVELWAEKPKKNDSGVFCLSDEGYLPGEGAIGHLKCELFPSVGLGECINVKEVS